MGRITITDIANKLKVAPSTVSRALNNHTSISEKTKKDVIALAEKLNYQPNIMAINLLRRKSNTIGVIVPQITSHFYSAIITSIQDVLSNTAFNLMVSTSEPFPIKFKTTLQEFYESYIYKPPILLGICW